MQIWCNEAQERYVLAMRAGSARRVPRAVRARALSRSRSSARATAEHQLVVEDPLFGNRPVDMDLSVLLGKPPKMTRDVRRMSAHPAGL